MPYVLPPTCLWRETLYWDPVEAGSLPEPDRPDIGQCLSNIRRELSRSRVLKNHCYKHTDRRLNSAMWLTEVSQDDESHEVHSRGPAEAWLKPETDCRTPDVARPGSSLSWDDLSILSQIQVLWWQLILTQVPSSTVMSKALRWQVQFQCYS